MLLHRGLQHFRRQAQKRLVDLAHQHNRPFDQPCNLGQQALILDHFKAVCKGLICRLGPDRPRAFRRIKDHAVLFQLGAVILERRYRKPPLAHETVAFGGVSSGDAIHGQRHDLGPGLIRQNAQDGLQRAHPAQGTRPPAHGFGPGEIADRVIQHFGHDISRRTARFFDHSKEHARLARIAFHQLVTGQASAAQEAFDCLFGRIDSGAFAFLAQGG